MLSSFLYLPLTEAMPRILSKEAILDLGGRKVVVSFVRNRMARRIIMRLHQDPKSGEDGIVVTLPIHSSFQEGLNFVNEKSVWVLKRLESLTPRVIFADGAVVPLRGVEHIIRHTSVRRGLVKVENKQVFVSCGAEHLERRVRDWLKGEARDCIKIKVLEKAAVLGCKPGRISIRDTKSRWGSCSFSGNLSFSWRLVMAPEIILDYVVAHEVSHLVEHNHGPEFWNLVECLTEDVAASRDWLKKYGEELHRIG
ncbi:MAG: SprT family zinc-dependent metalloprotease [Pseudomonadota bacterium]|nr:SprT family zinc-dependent metalloprotease [Pseudomonadota bacterium]